MAKKLVPIRYTSRDFASIKEDLVEHAKRYYPDTFQDFNEASFGALMLDTVAYVGDMLSFYLDYQVNESFLDTAIENITNDPTRYLILFVKKFMSFLFIDIQSSQSDYYKLLHYLPVLAFGITSLIGIILIWL